jgi:uncharacterized damage-inducible protein DinB
MTIPTEEQNNQSLTILFYRHNLWSNLRLCDACLRLNDEQINHSDSGTYGSIHRTLIHLIRAEARYLYHLVKWETTHASTAEDNPTVSDLKERVEESGKMLLQVATTIDPDGDIQIGDSDDYLPAKVILLQAVHHAHEHRTQICSMMGQLGIEPPELSGWTYYYEEMIGS